MGADSHWHRVTHWRAVLVGVLLAALAETLVFLGTGRVTLVGGFAGSAFAGYLASDAVSDGAWHGLLTALAWGIVLIPATVVLALTRGAALPFPFEYVLPTVDSAGEATAELLLGVTLPNALAGGLGSTARWYVDRSDRAWFVGRS